MTDGPVAAERGLLKSSQVALLLLAIASGFICAWIEHLNTEAGGVLPMPAGQGKWRSSVSREESWRRMKQFDGRPLTPTEKMQMDKDLKEGSANNRLRNAVSLWGVLQYPLVFVVLVWSLISFYCYRGLNRAASAISFSIVCISGFFMFNRAYFSSLGWWAKELVG